MKIIINSWLFVTRRWCIVNFGAVMCILNYLAYVKNWENNII